VKLLLEKGGQIDAKTKDGLSKFDRIISIGNILIVRV